MMLAAIAPLLGCGDATGAGTSAVAGEWTYAGTQETAPQATLDGSISWQGVSGGDAAFEGTFTLFERLQTGAPPRTLSGLGAGQLILDSIADFELSIDDGGRRHFGILRGDSISGDWVAFTGQVASGHFVLRRKQ